MRTLNIRNQFHLCRHKIGVTLCLLVAGFSLETFAQKTKSINLPFYDERKIHFGFQLGGMMSKLNTASSGLFVADVNDTTSAVAFTPLLSPGFSLGFIVSLRLKSELWNLRFLPTVSFYTREVMFEYPKQKFETKTYENTFVELPFLVKYKSIRRGNMRMYLVGGLTLGFKVAGDKQKLDPDQIITVNNNLEISYGVGMDSYFDFFKFAPELRFSHGIGNILASPNNAFAAPIGAVTTHRVCLYLNFE
jgi:hypothetical protein